MTGVLLGPFSKVGPDPLGALEQALAAQQVLLTQLRGDFRTELQAVRVELATIQELTGQSQQRLSELRRRFEEPVPAPAVPVDSGGLVAAPAPGGPGPGPGQMYEMSLQQYRRGSLSTARLGFQEFLRAYPQHERAPDAAAPASSAAPPAAVASSLDSTSRFRSASWLRTSRALSVRWSGSLARQ